MSDLLIKNMELPEECGYCHFHHVDMKGRIDFCFISKKIVDEEKRDEDCPLIVLPDHGDLIDKSEIEWTYDPHLQTMHVLSEQIAKQRIVLPKSGS